MEENKIKTAYQTKSTLLFMVFGDRCINQAFFSLFSILDIYQGEKPEFDIHIITDCPESFKPLETLLPLKTKHIDESVLKSWKGIEGNMMRAKIEAILHVLRSTGGNVLYLDSDTVLMNRIDWIFQYLAAGGYVMHKPEWRLGAGRKMNHELCPFDLEFTLSSGDDLKINSNSPMCNAGVIGVGAGSIKLVEAVMELYEKLYSNGPSWHIEQFAFSILLSRTKKLKFCRREIFHYWHNKDLAKSYIEAFDAEVGDAKVRQYRRTKLRFVWLARIHFYIHQLRVVTRKNIYLYKMFVYLRGNKS
jgi:hypothetical protein